MFVTPKGKELKVVDKRIKAAIILSPSPAPSKTGQDKAFGAIKVPCLHMTGTRDDGVAITEVRPSLGSWFDTARNVALFANEGGTYDDLAAYLRKRRLI